MLPSMPTGLLRGFNGRALALRLELLACSSPAAQRPVSVPAPPATPPTVSVEDGYALLQGSVLPQDMKGNPAAALEVALHVQELATKASDQRLLVGAKLLEAHAAGAGGDYARACRVGG